MEDLLPLISRHGYLLLAAVCFAEAVGFPLPAALAILTAGAVAAYGKLHFYSVFGVAFLAMLLGDGLLYFMGRVSGWPCSALSAAFPRILRAASCDRRSTSTGVGSRPCYLPSSSPESTPCRPRSREA